MVSKKILGVAIAAAMLSQGAFAFTTASDTQNISAQTLPDAGKVVKTAGQTGTYYAVTAGANIDTTMTGTLGTGFAIDQKVYVRVDLTNAVFATGRAIGNFTLVDYTAANVAANTMTADTLSQGGTAGAIAATDDHYVVYSVTPTLGNKFNIASAFSMTLGNLLAKGTGTVGVKVTAYDQLASAVAGTPVLSTSNHPTAFTFVTNGLTPAVTTLSPVASVEKLFKEFTVVGGTSTALVGTVGSFTANVTASVASAATGINVAAATEVANTATSTVKYVGDFAVGTWGVSATNACGTLTAVTVNTAKTEATIDLATAITKPFLCVTLAGTTAVPASTYTSSVTYTAIAGAATAIGAQAASSSSNLGSITRDGTSVLVPFININPDFNQKIIIVNRSTSSAALTLTNPIGDAAATNFALTTAGAATTTLPASKQTVLSSVDLFQVDTGSTSKKGSVTLNIAAPSSKVDVLFQTTNAQGAQNTVILQNDGKKFGGN